MILKDNITDEKLYVTKPFLPPVEEYISFVEKIFQSGQLTNQGENVKALEGLLSLNIGCPPPALHLVTNGTIALQIAIKALGINDGEIITTPFTYTATSESIIWQNCKPVFVDIEPDNFTIDTDKIIQAINENTRAIMPVHIFGYACNIEKIEGIAKKYNLKVIYDGAHAFDSKYKGKSLLNYGDITTCSFHATKLFHTIEGGCCVVKDVNVSKKIELLKRFGHNGDEHYCIGINGKMNEFCAAMGLVNYKYIDEIKSIRKNISALYDTFLTDKVIRPKKQEDLEYNYSYYPVIFSSEKELLRISDALKNENIFARRYFYPSLNTLPYLDKYYSCPISESISKRILCLPLHTYLNKINIEKISQIILNNIEKKVKL